MPTLKILITGGSGGLGQFINAELAAHFDILTLWNRNPGNCLAYPNARVNLLDPGALRRVFTEFTPDVLVHTAAIANQPELKVSTNADVFAVNVTATEQLCLLCREFSTRMIYTSSDLVYDGDRGSYLKENAKLNPLSIYAETKLIGEVKVQTFTTDYLILRTGLLYGFLYNHSFNHFIEMYRNFRDGKRVNLFTDMWRTPLALHDAARIIREAIEKNIPAGIYNYGGKERVSRLELGEMLCELAGFDKNLINAVSMYSLANYQGARDVSTDSTKLHEAGIYQESIQHSLKTILNSGMAPAGNG